MGHAIAFNFQPANFQPANFQPANFQPANFQPANFQPANFQPANFQPANFQKTPKADRSFYGSEGSLVLAEQNASLKPAKPEPAPE
ncbi:MAG: pentapeptide repeat-containing protein [Moorea sp. SIO3C2]|nr:pentapeptide repeat-containing protein [Moorena sp. SIO3C2]